MRTFFIALGITGVLIVTALLVAPSVVDWNAYRGALSEELSRATGRTVSLNGPIEASFLPAPRILANDVRLSASAPAKRSGDGEDFLRLRAVELRVGLLPLLTGHIVVERLTLVRPEFLVETEKDGRLHWVLDGAGGDVLPAVDLQRLAISDGTLVWRDRRNNNAQMRIENIFLSLAAGSMSGPAKAQGTARLGDVPVKFTASIGAFRDKAPVPLNVAADVSSLKSKAEFVGQLTPADGRITGRLKASGNDGRAVIAGLAGGPAASGVGPALLAHRFAVDARVSATIDSLEASDVVLEIADQRATGTVHARVPDAGSPAVDVAFRAPRLNLDSLATVPPIAASGGAATLPRDIKFGIKFEADAVLAAGRAVQGFAVDAALDQGRIAVKRLEGQLPGAGSVRLSGVVAPAGNSYRFDGDVDTAAANLRDLLSWLDVDTSAVPGGRLGRATLKAKLSADRDRAELKDVDLHVDSTRAHGSVLVDYRDKPGVALDLAADQLDVDAYLGDSDTDGGSAVPALADLAGEARLSIGQLTYRDVDMRNVDLTAAINDGEVSVSYFSGGPPEVEKMFGQKDPVPAAIDDSRVGSHAPVAAVQAPALALDSGTMAIPAPAPPARDPAPEARPDPAAEPGEPSRDDFVRDLLGRLAR